MSNDQPPNQRANYGRRLLRGTSNSCYSIRGDHRLLPAYNPSNRSTADPRL